MDKCKVFDENEQIIVSNCNNLPPYLLWDDLTYLPDPINIYNLYKKKIGYSWYYGDKITLVIDLNHTILHVNTEEREELLQIYVSDKEVELNFIDARGNVVYTFYAKPDEHARVSYTLNVDDDTLIERNTYTCTAVMINPKDLSRENLFLQPYKVYVK